jgi:hypothetical protein
MKGSKTFGKNRLRDSQYANLLSKIIDSNNIKSALEIGTPDGCNFIRLIHSAHPDLKIGSLDIIKTDLPNYVEFRDSISNIGTKEYDILFAIHVLEHIPTHQLVKFVDDCIRVSRYFIFEVPHCPDLNRVKESSHHTPHYSFFTLDSIFKLFGKKVVYEIEGKVLKFSNLEILQDIGSFKKIEKHEKN